MDMIGSLGGALAGGGVAGRPKPRPAATAEEAMLRRMEADLGHSLGRPQGMIQREQQAQRQMQHQVRMQQQERERILSTEGLVMRRRMYSARIVPVPPEPTPDEFEACMLGVISKIKKMHTEIYEFPPPTIELGSFLHKRLQPWMDQREVEKLVVDEDLSREVETIDGHVCRMVETKTVWETRDILKGMIVETHPDETWIDIP